MKLTQNVQEKLQSLFFLSPDKDCAVNRLKAICKKYSINLHFLEFDFKDWNIQQVDETYSLIISI
jgi:hypothetical protein